MNRERAASGQVATLNRVPAEARIAVVTTILSPLQSSAGVPPAPAANPSKGRRDACATLSRGESVVVAAPAAVRAQFRRVKPLKDISVKQRGESKTPKAFGAGCVEHRAGERTRLACCSTRPRGEHFGCNERYCAVSVLQMPTTRASLAAREAPVLPSSPANWKNSVPPVGCKKKFTAKAPSTPSSEKRIQNLGVLPVSPACPSKLWRSWKPSA